MLLTDSKGQKAQQCDRVAAELPAERALRLFHLAGRIREAAEY